MKDKKLWFKAKNFGWGWRPVSWQGWLVTLIYVTYLVVTVNYAEKIVVGVMDAIFLIILPLVVVSICFITICFLRGEKPEWRWGGNIENAKRKTIAVVITLALLGGCLLYGVYRDIINKDCCAGDSIVNKSLVEKYIKDNISQLSPTKEVLGGKFFVTSINFIGENSGVVEYEDGHILLKSKFNYFLGKDGKIQISDFKVIKIN